MASDLKLTGLDPKALEAAYAAVDILPLRDFEHMGGERDRLLGHEGAQAAIAAYLTSLPAPTELSREVERPVEWRYLFHGKGGWKHVYSADAANALIAENATLRKGKQHIVEPLYTSPLSREAQSRDEVVELRGEWPPLIELGRTLAMLTLRVKSSRLGEQWAWDDELEQAYKRANTAMQDLWTALSKSEQNP